MYLILASSKRNRRLSSNTALVRGTQLGDGRYGKYRRACAAKGCMGGFPLV